MFKKIIFLVLAGCVPGQLPAATLNVVDGELIGAFDVDVLGSLYNVEFIDGTCVELFDGCTAESNYPFPQDGINQPTWDAALALLEQVFIDGPLGNFDSTPSLTRGCADVWCGATTPWGASSILAATAYNTDGSRSAVDADRVFQGGPGQGSPLDSTDSVNYVFAVWTPVNVVPVPAAVWLFGTALIGLIGLGRRKKAALR